MLVPVVNQVTLGSEGFSASSELATEWLLTGVDSDVSLQVTFLCEGLAASIALEGLLSSVSALMDLKTT